jgi:transposase, IS5 family
VYRKKHTEQTEFEDFHLFFGGRLRSDNRWVLLAKMIPSDEETVEQIREKPYLRYFLGYSCFSDEKPFDPSMMVHFRRRMGEEVVSQINDRIISLLNEVREKTESLIDTLYKPDRGDETKPRTYRRKARKQYLQVAKSRKPRMKAIRKALKQQLQYIWRNLETISPGIPRQAEPSVMAPVPLSVGVTGDIPAAA